MRERWRRPTQPVSLPTGRNRAKPVSVPGIGSAGRILSRWKARSRIACDVPLIAQVYIGIHSRLSVTQSWRSRFLFHATGHAAPVLRLSARFLFALARGDIARFSRPTDKTLINRTAPRVFPSPHSPSSLLWPLLEPIGARYIKCIARPINANYYRSARTRARGATVHPLRRLCKLTPAAICGRSLPREACDMPVCKVRKVQRARGMVLA